MSLKEFLAEQRKALPDQPGVYIFYDREGRVIYVGKAKSIRKRVTSHMSRPRVPGDDLAALVDRVDFVVTQTEAEALLAEQSFIKQHRPRYNIRLRDDKSYPYIGVSLDESFPRVYFTRERHIPGRAYFGPFSSAKKVRQTLDLLGKIFQFRTCEGAEPGRATGNPCLDYHIKRCQAPCVGYVSDDQYRQTVEAIMSFLSGRYTQIERDLEAGMRDAASAQEFERATLFRNRLGAIRSLLERQRVAGTQMGTLDAIGVATDDTEANVQVFQVRDGVLADRLSFYLDNAGRYGEDEVAEEFLGQYYTQAVATPREIVVPAGVRPGEALREALAERREGPVNVHCPERGDKRRILELALRNARLALAQDRLRKERRRQQRVAALDGLRELLGLEAVPMRLEGYDISNLGPTHTVASMVVFEGGVPKKADYRRFVIRSASGQDDFAAVEEVLARRFARFSDERDRSPYDADRDASFAALPQVVVIDGGKGQLAAGLKVLGELSERGVSVISLAKRLEEVFLPGRVDPLLLSRESEVLQLLQRVRDEAHRFAIEHHRRRRDRVMTVSLLDELPGVGPARKRLLLRHFGSAERVAKASREELEAVSGLPGKVARRIHEQLHRAG